MHFDPDAWLSQVAQSGAVKAFARELVKHADKFGELDGSRGWLRGIGREAKLTTSQADMAVQRLRDGRNLEMIRPGDSTTQSPARWALVCPSSPVAVTRAFGRSSGAAHVQD